MPGSLVVPAVVGVVTLVVIVVEVVRTVTLYSHTCIYIAKRNANK